MDGAEWLQKYLRLSNYLSAAMLYLKENVLLEEELKPEHIKTRILGHWGTVPGINLVYGGLNYLTSTIITKDSDTSINQSMLIVGPGHGAPAVIAGLYLEDTLFDFYPELTQDRAGLQKLIRDFSWPGGFPSHTYPGLPGQIHEGGELGYSLANAFGAVMDKPDLLSVCIVGDGEAETAALASSWQGNKFLNHAKDGAVLPILHLNRYRISGPTLFSVMTKEEIAAYFIGLGYEPYFIEHSDSDIDTCKRFLNTLQETYLRILDYKKEGGKLPIIILDTPKGWTGVEYLEGKKIEGNHLSHGIPIENPQKNEEEFKALDSWLKSYNVLELFDDNRTPIEEIRSFIPTGNDRVGYFEHSPVQPLKLPSLEDHAFRLEQRGTRPASRMTEFAQYIRDLISANTENTFRIFSPDESESNKLGDMLDVTKRVLSRPVPEWNEEEYAEKGRVVEMLSENVLEGMMEAYIKTGRYGILISYEAFLGIVTTQLDQYIKYLKQSKSIKWREQIFSLNLVATSTGWRQDHNGFSHQNPTLINSLLAKESEFVHTYFPVDVNTMLATTKKCVESTNCVNLITADKRDLPQWVKMDEAIELVEKGYQQWDWAGNNPETAEVVLVGIGDHQTKEMLAAAKILKQDIPELNFSFVNFNNPQKLSVETIQNEILTADKPVVINFHGYPSAIKQLVFGTGLANRSTILGYIEEGTTTTPFDIQVVNKASRYHACIAALESVSRPELVEKVKHLIQKYEEVLTRHHTCIRENGTDLPEVDNLDLTF